MIYCQWGGNRINCWGGVEKFIWFQENEDISGILLKGTPIGLCLLYKYMTSKCGESYYLGLNSMRWLNVTKNLGIWGGGACVQARVLAFCICWSMLWTSVKLNSIKKNKRLGNSKSTKVGAVTEVWVLSLPGSVTRSKIAFLDCYFCICCLAYPLGPFWLAGTVIRLPRKSCVHTTVSEEGSVASW